MDDKERILLRVKKMLALANDAAASEGERDNALRMAHATLAKHNLSMTQAEVTGKQSETRGYGQYYLREYAWMRRAAYAIGLLFFCDFFVQRTYIKHASYIFIGKESNVQTAILMTQYIINSIDREGIAQSKYKSETSRGTYWRSFCKGAVYRVHERCVQIIAATEKESIPISNGSTGTALVLASVYATEKKANQKLIEQDGIKVKTQTSKQRRPDAEGFLAGVEYGNKVQLNKQLT